MLLVAALVAAGAALVSELLWRSRGSREAEPAPGGYSLARLLVASFLVIFAELAIIRWMSVEVRVFAYFKNLALLVCFLGFGMGCALARTRLRWKTGVVGLLGLVAVVRLPLAQRAHVFEQLSSVLGGGASHSIWAADSSLNLGQFALGAVVATALLFLITTTFVPLGQIVSGELARAPRTLRAYSWNLAASLAGVVAFLAVSRFLLGPQVWISVVLAGVGALQRDRRRILQVACMIVPVVALFPEGKARDVCVLWTPYQQIEVTRLHFPDGEPSSDLVRVNHTGYQRTVNLSREFLVKHAAYFGIEPGYSNFDIPFRFRPAAKKVLIVGSGTGNDVAAALRSGAEHIDAVEIDPAIYALGRASHPEHPYDSPRVSIYLTDARAFLRRTKSQYDLVVFAGLDSHTEFSDYSNMRLDNFVYTEEALADARAHLRSDGIFYLGFEVNRPWLGARLRGLVERAFGKQPLVFVATDHFLGNSTCFVASPGGQVESALAADARLAAIAQNKPAFLNHAPVPLSTDDWPYLYSERRSIPPTYYTIGILLFLIAAALYGQIPAARQQRPSLFFFAMGAGFMLLETQAISRLALYFGTTWVVNGIVIAAVLATLMVSNAVAEKFAARISLKAVTIALAASLLLAYVLPFVRLAPSANVAGAIAALFFSIPVFLAGLLFAREFGSAADPAVALGSNMLGAVAGGLLENLAFLWGMRAMLLVAVVVYAVAVISLRRAPGLAAASQAGLPEALEAGAGKSS